MRIALFGGSFNPIHVGHLAIADAIIGQGLADRVWLTVSPHNPLKPRADLLPEQLRLTWVRTAAEDHRGVEASDCEFSLPRPSYTYQTLRHLREEHPADEFLLCIGGDNWANFSAWREPEEIRRHHRLIVYPRSTQGFGGQETAPEGVTFLRAPLIDVSSTDIRRRLDKGESIEGLVPLSICESIQSEWKKIHP